MHFITVNKQQMRLVANIAGSLSEMFIISAVNIKAKRYAIFEASRKPHLFSIHRRVEIAAFIHIAHSHLLQDADYKAECARHSLKEARF